MGDVDTNEKKSVVEGDDHDEKKVEEEKKEIPLTQDDSALNVNRIVADSKDIVEDETLFRSLQQLPFYHGFLPREDLRTLLRHDGDYLIRVSEVTVNDKKSKKDSAKDDKETTIKRDLILSVFESNAGTAAAAAAAAPSVHVSVDQTNDKDPKSSPQFEGKLRNMVVRRYNGKFGIEMTQLFESITELLAHYNQSNTQEAKKNRFLKNPVKLQGWEYRHTDLKLGALLGEGAYGEVRTGVLTRKGREVEVAVKLMKGTADLNKVKIREMMKEARLMRAFKHQNVVRFYGVAVDEQPLYIILELVRGGALNSYLQKNRKIPVLELMNMCLGAAAGLQYLHSNNCIHRDIAARNCLYSNDNVVKLSDFGLSRIGNSYKLCSSQKLPIKWLAAETILTLYFTFKTDVYSYGVMCYEIFSEGDEPWNGITNTETKKNVCSGKHLQIPDRCPEKFRTFIYEKIYVKDAKRRVNMEDVTRFIEPLLTEIPAATPDEQAETKNPNRSDRGRKEAKSEMLKSTPRVDHNTSQFINSSKQSTHERTREKLTTQKRNNKLYKTARRASAHPGNHNMIEK